MKTNRLRPYPVGSLTVPCWVVIFSFCFGIGFAQQGLRDIPSTKVEDQLLGFKLPEGAKINLFASEPLVKKPVHMNWDSKGRLWVVSSPMYPHIKPGQDESDQVVVLEDLDGDGKADTSMIFADDLHIPTAVLPGDGGAYIANSTEMIFLKDTNDDGKADHRRIVLSGFGTEDTHHLLHTFRWGPEGMIWMNQSIYIHTHLETPYGIRRLLGGGMWYFRPETQRAEVFMKGLINPWGHAFDEWGQSFMTDGAGSEGINFVFPKSVFRTSPGATRFVSGLNPGQPKHCGLEVLSGNHIPDALQGALAAPDFRGHRINLFKLSDNGTSGYNSTQQEDLVANTHRAFRPIDIKMGPDGAIYIADWYNPIIQHGEVDFRDERRDHIHGRIWRISFTDRELDQKADFESMSEQMLAKLAGPVGWNQQMATVELKKRDPDLAAAGIEASWLLAESEKEKLHLVYASQAINRLQEEWAVDLAIDAETPEVRAGALRALYYSANESCKAKDLCLKAVTDPHPRVRLWGVSTLSQQHYPDTVHIALKALEGTDESDDYLNFAVWRICREHSHKWLPEASVQNPFETTEQLLFALRAVGSNRGAEPILQAFESGEIKSDEAVSNVADWISRSGDSSALTRLYQRALAPGTPENQKVSILAALTNAAKLRKMRPSGDLNRVTQFFESDNPDLYRESAALAGYWKVPAANQTLKENFLGNDWKKSTASLEGLRLMGGQETNQFLQGLANDSNAPDWQRTRAITGLVRLNPAAAARLAVRVLPTIKKPEDSGPVFDSFLSNKNATTHLTKALKGGAKLPEAIALVGLQKANSAPTRPQPLIKAIQQAGGIEQMKMALSPREMTDMVQKVMMQGDPHRGEEIYRRNSLQCVFCHAIGNAGGLIGPDLISIGSSAPVDYLIESLLEPSKKIKEGYHTTLITMKDSNTFAGAVVREDANELVIRDVTGNENRLAKNQIKKKEVSPISLMPMALTAQLREDEFVDLVRFLSELGKEGKFKTGATRYIRSWNVLQPHERTRDDIGHYGKKIFAEDFKTYQWTPFVAKVDGSLPIGEMPNVVGRGRNRYGVARVSIKASEDTDVRLKIEGKRKDLAVFLDEVEVKIPEVVDNSMNFDLGILVQPGEHYLTLIGLRGHGLEDVRIEVIDAGKATIGN